MKVDVHAHCYPEAYMKELRKIGIGESGGFGTKMPPWTSADERIELMDRLGIDMQILTLSAPNVYFSDAELSRALAQMTNDFISDICKEHPDRFMGSASIPLNNMEYAMAELHRAINDLGMDGVVLGTNVNQRSLAEDRFLPFLEKLNKARIPVHLHPMKAIGEDLMPEEYEKLAIPPNVGFIFETTRTIAEMTFKGTFEKYGNLTFILPHCGGAIPFLYPRWDMGYLARPHSHPLRKLPNAPSHYLRRHYYDTAQSYHPSVLKCTIELAGVDHLLFGTDCPYTTDDLRVKKVMDTIESCGFSNEERQKISFGNIARLFPKIKRYLPPM